MTAILWVEQSSSLVQASFWEPGHAHRGFSVDRTPRDWHWAHGFKPPGGRLLQPTVCCMEQARHLLGPLLPALPAALSVVSGCDLTSLSLLICGFQPHHIPQLQSDHQHTCHAAPPDVCKFPTKSHSTIASAVCLAANASTCPNARSAACRSRTPDSCTWCMPATCVQHA